MQTHALGPEPGRGRGALGIDKTHRSRLVNDKDPDPRSSTLVPYTLAFGKRLAWSLEDLESYRPR